MDGAGVFDAKATWERIQRNRDRLDICPRHSFDELPIEAIRLGGKITCKVCGGEMPLLNVSEYIRGYEAAGKSGNDILPGWKPSNEPGTDAPKRRYFTPED